MSKNGFLVLDEKDWEEATPEQRDWMVFKTLRSLDSRMQVIENRSWVNNTCSAIGGIFGGAFAYLAIKFGLK